MAVKTYIDVGGLIAVMRGEDKMAATARSFLYEPLREYVTSDYVKLELLPKCTFHKNEEERQFYEEFFKSIKINVPNSDELLAFAIDEGCKTGISGIDAI